MFTGWDADRRSAESLLLSLLTKLQEETLLKTEN